MTKLTRRGLIKQASIGVGTTGVLAAAVTTGVHFGTTTSASAHVASQALGNATEPTVVCVKDAAAGTLVVMRGEREIVVRDPGLVRSLLSL